MFLELVTWVFVLAVALSIAQPLTWIRASKDDSNNYQRIQGRRRLLWGIFMMIALLVAVYWRRVS